MSESTMNDTQSVSKSSWLKLLIPSLPYLALYIASLVLIAMTESQPAQATTLWKWFMPVVALVSMMGGWRFSGEDAKEKGLYIAKQLLYWGAVLLVINLLFMGDTSHFLNAETQGFVIAYILGLSALLSGIYLDWKMSLFGAFMIASAIGLAFLDDNALLISVAAVVVAGLVMMLLLRRRGKATD